MNRCHQSFYATFLFTNTSLCTLQRWIYVITDEERKENVVWSPSSSSRMGEMTGHRNKSVPKRDKRGMEEESLTIVSISISVEQYHDERS